MKRWTAFLAALVFAVALGCGNTPETGDDDDDNATSPPESPTPPPGFALTSGLYDYNVTDELKKAMEGLLEPTFKEVTLGRAEVRETFKVPKVGTIAGCYILEGRVARNAEVRLLRDNVVIFEGKLGSLRRFKDDVSEVKEGFECGIGLAGYNDIKLGDVIEAFVMEKVQP